MAPGSAIKSDLQPIVQRGSVENTFNYLVNLILYKESMVHTASLVCTSTLHNEGSQVGCSENFPRHIGCSILLTGP